MTVSINNFGNIVIKGAIGMFCCGGKKKKDSITKQMQ